MGLAPQRKFGHAASQMVPCVATKYRNGLSSIGFSRIKTFVKPSAHYPTTIYNIVLNNKTQEPAGLLVLWMSHVDDVGP